MFREKKTDLIKIKKKESTKRERERERERKEKYDPLIIIWFCFSWKI